MEISINAPKERFDAHLALKGNSRILFSGKFGTGKSYFLKKYFDIEVERFNVFNLSPVNYVVGANQDIFEWIKVDIAMKLIELIPKNDNNPEIKDSLVALTYIHNNLGKYFSSLTLAGLKLCAEKGVIPLSSGIIDLFKESFEKINKEIKSLEELKKYVNTSDSEKLEDYVSNETNKPGSIFEDDLKTQIIRNTLLALKAKTEKENILIIDDLDRLDPEHIFRILNILSAHNDHFDSNKFGFDKVIVVCDLDNIHHIYKYKYGIETDFNGYIDKFYTTTPFKFRLEDLISYETEELSFIGDKKIVKHILDTLLRYFISKNIIKVRHIQKLHSKNIKLEKSPNLTYDNDIFIEYNKKIKISKSVDPRETDRIHLFLLANNNFTIEIHNFFGIQILNYLIELFGSIEILKEHLSKFSSDTTRVNTALLPEIYSIFLSPIFFKENINSHKLFGEYKTDNNGHWWFDTIQHNLYSVNYKVPTIIDSNNVVNYNFTNSQNSIDIFNGISWGIIFEMMIKILDLYSEEHFSKSITTN